MQEVSLNYYIDVIYIIYGEIEEKEKKNKRKKDQSPKIATKLQGYFSFYLPS